MLDTIIYIPTILAYAFIGMLVVILCFIVIYVSHNVFASVYANLPVPNSVSTMPIVPAEPNPANMRMKSYPVAASTALCGRKSKTALRIIVMLEPCYLAYVLFAYEAAGGGIMHSEKRQSPNCATVNSVLRYNKLVKYFDQLADIPIGNIMQKCGNPAEEPQSSAAVAQRRISPLAERVPNRAMLHSLIDGMVQNNANGRRYSRAQQP